jgi:hypothetical protein
VFQNYPCFTCFGAGSALFEDKDMPTIVVLGNVKIQIFGDDHAPPHFHVVTPDGEALVRISDLKVLAGAIRGRDERRALEWARLHHEELSDAWERYSG